MTEREKTTIQAWIEEIAGDVTWKKEALHEALDNGYIISLVKNDNPISLVNGEVAFCDNGIIGILSKTQVVLQAEKKN